jgi:hypothetical protein
VRSFHQFITELAVSGTALNNKTWYHGTASHVPGDKLKPPVFLTSSLKGAEFYATRGTGPGVIYQYRVAVQHAFSVASYADAVTLKKILTPLDIILTMGSHGWDWYCSAVEQHSPYDGTNPFDVVYVPDAVNRLRAAGYDAFYERHDPTEYDEDAEALAMFDTSHLTFINAIKRFK